MSEQLVNQIKLNYDLICGARKEIAQLKKDKSIKRKNAWAEAQGTAKEKEDYVKSIVANEDQEIRVKEANIEHMYNMIHIWEQEILWSKDE